MKLAVAQLRPVVGAVGRNIDRHLALTAAAASLGAQLVIFPELSLTGYEPKLAGEFACLPSDTRLQPLQAICNASGISLGVGAPLDTGDLPCISTFLFRPVLPPLVYSKSYLHPDEVPFFQPGRGSPSLLLDEPPVALAICFELSVPQHATGAHQAGATVYVASAAKTAAGVKQAGHRLSQIAAELGMPTLLSNCLGLLDGAECAGGSAVWDRAGNMVAQLDDKEEGVIVLDCDSGEVATATA